MVQRVWFLQQTPRVSMAFLQVNSKIYETAFIFDWKDRRQWDHTRGLVRKCTWVFIYLDNKGKKQPLERNSFKHCIFNSCCSHFFRSRAALTSFGHYLFLHSPLIPLLDSRSTSLLEESLPTPCSGPHTEYLSHCIIICCVLLCVPLDLELIPLCTPCAI